MGQKKNQLNKHIDWEKEEFAPLDTKRPTIPQEVAEYIDQSKSNGYALLEVLNTVRSKTKEWLEFNDDNLQKFIDYYRKPSLFDIEKKVLYVIKAPRLWDEDNTVYLQHLGTDVTGWVEMTSEIEKASTYSLEEAIGIMNLFKIDWDLVRV